MTLVQKSNGSIWFYSQCCFPQYLEMFEGFAMYDAADEDFETCRMLITWHTFMVLDYHCGYNVDGLRTVSHQCSLALAWVREVGTGMQILGYSKVA